MHAETINSLKIFKEVLALDSINILKNFKEVLVLDSGHKIPLSFIEICLF